VFLPVFLNSRGVIIWYYGVIIAYLIRLVFKYALIKTTDREIVMPVATFVSNLLKKGDIFCDVGAFDGLLSLVGATVVGRSGEVHAFEPNYLPFKKMSKIFRGYRLDWISINNLAVGDTIHKAKLFVPLNKPTESFLFQKEDVIKRMNGSVIKTHVVNLDHYFINEKRTAPTLIKIDVEGTELEVLLGARKLLSIPNKPIIVFEACASNQKRFGRNVNDIILFLNKFNYKFYRLRTNHIHIVENEEDILNNKSSNEVWTDILALDPVLENHKVRLELLLDRFKIQS